MGNLNVGRILPVFDTLLLLVTTLFGTAGLLRSIEPSPGDGSVQKESSAERDRLAAEVEAKRGEANELEKKLRDQQRYDGLGLDALQTLLQTAGSKQEKLAEIQGIITDVHGKLEGAKTVVQDKYNSVTLEDAIKALKLQIEQLERRKHDLENEITQEDRRRAEIQELQRKLEAIQSEIRRLKALIEELEQKPKDPTPSGGRLGLFRNYHRGPFLLLECDDKGVMVYPGSKRIAVDSSAVERDWLKEQVRRTGAAQLLVRPNGFKDSYAKFYELLTELADKEESAGKKIILNFWPIEANESIQEYLPERS
jgi:hypothetical protein